MNFDKLRDLLENSGDLPGHYSFKFVVKSDQKHKVLELLGGHQVNERESKSGTYTSVTSTSRFETPDEVISIYREVCQIEGVISL